MSSTIQQDFVDSIELRSIVRAGDCRVDLKPPGAALVVRSELMYFLHNRFRLSVRVRNPHGIGISADLPFSDMSAPFHSRAGIAIYNWMSDPSVPYQVVKRPVPGAAGPERV